MTLRLGILIVLLIVISVIDIRTMKIPDYLIIITAAVSLLRFLEPEEVSLLQYLSGLIPSIAILILSVILKHLTHHRLLGGGDIKLIAALGLHLGPYSTLLTVLLASILAIIIYRKQKFPFAPMLSVATVVIVLFLN